MFTNLLRSMASVFCSHEWARRRDASRVYLECVHCLTTTPGIAYGPESVSSTAPVLAKELKVVRV